MALLQKRKRKAARAERKTGDRLGCMICGQAFSRVGPHLATLASGSRVLNIWAAAPLASAGRLAQLVNYADNDDRLHLLAGKGQYPRLQGYRNLLMFR